MARTPTVKEIKACITEAIISCGMTSNDLFNHVANKLGFRDETVFRTGFEKAVAQLESEEKIKTDGELYFPGLKLEIPPQPADPLTEIIETLRKHRTEISRIIRKLEAQKRERDQRG